VTNVWAILENTIDLLLNINYNMKHKKPFKKFKKGKRRVEKAIVLWVRLLPVSFQ